MTRLRQFVVLACSSAALSIGLLGCAHDERPQGLSGSAVMAVEGDKTVSYTAPTDGMVTIYDVHDEKTIYSGQVLRGQNVMVDGDQRQVTIDGRVVDQNNVDPGNIHRVYFEPTNHVEKTATVETHSTSVETEHADH